MNKEELKNLLNESFEHTDKLYKELDAIIKKSELFDNMEKANKIAIIGLCYSSIDLREKLKNYKEFVIK